MATLKIGTTYNFYTKYATIVSKKVKVAALLSYDECSKYSYDIKTLAINERVISIKDEDLENEIGEDNIYLLRSTVPNADNTYNEYIVWDSIIDYTKTTALDAEYTANLTLVINDAINYNISQVIAIIQQAVSDNFGNLVELNITNLTNNGNEKAINDPGVQTILTPNMLERAESIVNSLNSFETKLIPAAQAITNSGINEKIMKIADNISVINSQIALIKRGIT